MQLLPQSENVFIVLKDGWHGPETPPNDAHIEWQWTRKKQATLAFKNPKKDSEFYLDLDNPSGTFPEGQHVQVKMADQVLDDFVLTRAPAVEEDSVDRGATRIGDMVELTIDVDKTFVPALLPASTNRDSRELGIRVFHLVRRPEEIACNRWVSFGVRGLCIGGLLLGCLALATPAHAELVFFSSGRSLSVKSVPDRGRSAGAHPSHRRRDYLRSLRHRPDRAG